MIYDTEKYVNVLIRLKITPNQFFICWVLYNKQYALLKAYMDMSGVFNRHEIDDLVDKDIITRIKKDSYDVDNLFVGLRFADEMIIEPEDAWEEFFNAYPAYLKINDTKIAARGLTLSDERAAKEKYFDLLKKNKYLHKKVLLLLEGWKRSNNGYATMKIDKFLTSKYWVELENAEVSNVKPRLY